MSDKLILYNIPSKVDTWSGSVAKVKYLLDANNISYETVWVPFNKIGETLAARGIKPNPEPPLYTLPAITIGDLTISDSSKIVKYFIENQDDLIKKGILKDEFKAYNDLVTPEFFQYFENFIIKSEPLHDLIYKLLLANEVHLLNDEDQQPFIESRLIKGVDIPAIERQAKELNIARIWENATNFLNRDLKESFNYPGLQRDKFLTGKFVYGDELTWADILFFTRFNHLEELAKANVEYSKIPENGLVDSEWIKAWIKRVEDIIN
ncbi:hypothetical protein WICMUC_002925 [Wickerhamomyces mucosus]|uniref:GST N-terminal domain-containing protein n=1 Tax=Wickerhamomyces mucosus TaxID=1378264 RepID=A0A9P8TD48_9ASCO|nr:hypothetical protein WICMUC_002925 [Wickerhamomyces mucosus]